MSGDISDRQSNIGVCIVFSTHLRVACQDGVVAVIVQGGCSSVQGAGSIRLSADPVVLAPLRDLLTIFKPVDLQHKIIQLSDKLCFSWTDFGTKIAKKSLFPSNTWFILMGIRQTDSRSALDSATSSVHNLLFKDDMILLAKHSG